MTVQRLILIAVLVWLGAASFAEAGMPSFTLSDIPTKRSLTRLVQMRLEVVSFFGLALLLSAAAIRWVWNGWRKDFPKLPRLSYGKALGVVLLWGLLFLLVLTMISGARELMTPGAWKKEGFTYQLAPELTPEAQGEVARYQAIDQLRRALLDAGYREQPERDWETFPRSKQALDTIPENAWHVPGTKGLRYVYVAPESDDAPGDERDKTPTLYEPEGVGRYRLVVMQTGAIRAMTSEEIERALKRTESREAR